MAQECRGQDHCVPVVFPSCYRELLDLQLKHPYIRQEEGERDNEKEPSLEKQSKLFQKSPTELDSHLNGHRSYSYYMGSSSCKGVWENILNYDTATLNKV